MMHPVKKANKVLVLVRHVQSLLNAGETDFHDCDVSKKGQSQIDGLAMSLKLHLGHNWLNKPFRGFVSPFLRTLRTAVPIQKLGIPFVVDHRIAEAPDEAYKKLKLSEVVSRHEDFAQYDWKLFPVNGVSQEERVMQSYYAGLEHFLKTLPEYAIVVTHMSPVQDLVARISGKTNGMIGNASITLIEDGKLVFCGRT